MEYHRLGKVQVAHSDPVQQGDKDRASVRLTHHSQMNNDAMVCGLLVG